MCCCRGCRELPAKPGDENMGGLVWMASWSAAERSGQLLSTVETLWEELEELELELELGAMV
jgi:hypothetical protein